MTAYRPALPIPVTKRVRLEYAQNYLLSSTSSAIAYQQWRINSLYDPDYTGAGHQPMGYDYLATQYSTYCVGYVTVRYKIINYTTGPLVWSFRNALIGSVPTDVTLEMERQDGVGGIVGPNLSYEGTYKCNLLKLTGMKEVTYKTKYDGLFGANPNDVLWLNFSMQGMDGTIVTKCALSVDMFFDSEVRDALNQSQN